ncbi:MAG TPA: branched-chain amino acid transaminase [Candidatus Binatia bacterium]|nr:branched-chain amino acid transaminase [Candidatus Binatia bacterium]
MTQTASPAASDAATRREQSWVFFDGEFRRYRDAKIGLLTQGLNYGTGCFEGIRAYWSAERGQLYGLWFPEHYRRMKRNARALLMSVPHSVDELCDITVELLRRNEYRQTTYIRPLVFKSGEEIGFRLHDIPDSFAILTTPMGDYVPTSGMRCMVSTWRRIDDTVAPPRTKCTGIYINSALAKSEALEAGFDEAIMLTTAGHVCEGTGENIFVVRDGVVATPPPSENILEGITRQGLMHLFREEMGLDVVERSIGRSELYAADEVFMCGTGAQIAPVVEIDRRTVGDGEPGPLTLRIQDLYRHIVVGAMPKYAEWLRPVW